MATNASKHTATATNTSKSGSVVGQQTITSLSSYTMSRLAPYTFNSVLIPVANAPKHTA